jgi:hypothetical protein
MSRTIKRIYVDARDGVVPAQIALAVLLSIGCLLAYYIVS